ncbi:MAG: chemotaxis protein CheD [Chromatiales bacterium]|nr:chemotaxis protein CheD [Chromatiales bacterium]
MNHFLLAHKRRYPQDIPIIQSEAGRYGINAMELVINEMMKQGAQRRNLRAKVFGGGDVLRYYKNGRNNFFYVGEVNCRFAREFLKNETIPVVASDLGGDYGRVIHFQSTDFAVYMKKIAHSKDTVDIEHNYWKKTIQQQDELEQKETQFW